MRPSERDTGSILQINVALFGSVFWAIAAWWLWPSSIEWWGMGLLSIVLGLVAGASLVKAIRIAIASWRRRKAFAEFAAQGGAPKSARVASEADLRQAGMIE